jgi:hypothetical protein
MLIDEVSPEDPDARAAGERSPDLPHRRLAPPWRETVEEAQALFGKRTFRAAAGRRRREEPTTRRGGYFRGWLRSAPRDYEAAEGGRFDLQKFRAGDDERTAPGGRTSLLPGDTGPVISEARALAHRT